jgi:predicted DNA-binding protein YlxM (UPF0122 family)
MTRPKRGKVGQPTLLTDEAVLIIKDCVLDGMNSKEIAEKLGVSENTVYSWRHNNTKGIVDKINTWETQRMLVQAESFSDKLMNMNTLNPDGTVNKGLVAIQQKESEFLREKLLIARDKYNSGNVVNVNVALPQPIIDLGKVVSTQEPQKSLEK